MAPATIAVPPSIPSALRTLIARALDSDVMDRSQALHELVVGPTQELDETALSALTRFSASDRLVPQHGELVTALFRHILEQPDQTPLLTVVLDTYPSASNLARGQLLTCLAAMATPASARSLVELLRRFGRPHRLDTLSPRSRQAWLGLVQHANVVFPELYTLAPDDPLTLELLRAGFEEQRFAAPVKAQIAPSIRDSLAAAIASARSFQRDRGTAWRFSSRYAPKRQRVAQLSALAGHLQADAPHDLLGAALELRDPRMRMDAAVALMRLDMRVDDAVLDSIAACHETRAIFYEELTRLDMLDRFPKAWKTHEAFAAADLVRWLMHPHELGRAPTRLTLMQTFSLDDDKRHIYVWRFAAQRGRLVAGVSGPFAITTPPRPAHGSHTGSRFESWDTRTTEDHLVAQLAWIAGVPHPAQ